MELTLENLHPRLYENVEKLLVIQHLRNIKKDVKGNEHTWIDGPDGQNYHCAICGISKCGDYGSYSTCESWIIELLIDIVNRLDNNDVYFKSLAEQWNKFSERRLK